MVLRAFMCSWLIILGGCGGSDEIGTSPTPSSGSEKPECAPCFASLTRETDLCGPALDRCTDNPMNSAEQHIQCFLDDGACYVSALNRSAQCNQGCGDTEQANVETCTASCFDARARCAETALRRADACLDQCSGATCDTCTTRGQAEFDGCDMQIIGCSENCKRTHRR